MGVQNSPFWQLGQKSAHPKNTIKIGVSIAHFPFFGKQFCITKWPLLGQKQNPEILVIIFLPFSSLSTTKTQNLAETPSL